MVGTWNSSEPLTCGFCWLHEWADCSCIKFLNAGRTCRATQCSSVCSKTSLFKVQEQLQRQAFISEKNKTVFFCFFCAADPLKTLSVIIRAAQQSEGLLDTDELNDMMVVCRSWVWARSGREATWLGRWVEVRRWDGWRRRCRNTRRRRSLSSCLWTGKHHLARSLYVCVCHILAYRFHQLCPDFCLFTLSSPPVFLSCRSQFSLLLLCLYFFFLTYFDTHEDKALLTQMKDMNFQVRIIRLADKQWNQSSGTTCDLCWGFNGSELQCCYC